MKKEQKEKILNGSFELLKESAGLLGKVLEENYDDCTEKRFIRENLCEQQCSFLNTGNLIIQYYKAFSRNQRR